MLRRVRARCRTVVSTCDCRAIAVVWIRVAPALNLVMIIDVRLCNFIICCLICIGSSVWHPVGVWCR
ncbi:hypothetical protein BKA70DRAFT_1261004 [Coprinopsis sp. MPI-PUGE-AT-0042]|nr:hypothetical protein BKA70DRAFT_1261004 [Coprinopsis sp. MPI-PUGE-AT-0042]